MRILFIDQFGELGGAQQCLLDLLPAVLGAGWEATVCAPASGPLGARAKGLGCDFQELELGAYASGSKPLGQKLRFGWATLGAVRILDAEVLRRRPALLYANGPRVLAAAAVVARRRRLPLIFHCHNRLTDGVSIRLCRRALELGAAHLISCCRFAEEPIASALDADHRRVIYNGVPGPSGTRGLRRDSMRTVGVLGRIAPEKGQAEFLEAARIVQRQRRDCRFAVCGSVLFGDPDAMRYSECLKRLADGVAVEFMGWRDDAQAVLREWDIAAVPSVREPATPRVILEAFAAGAPVIAFATGGIPEVVEDGRTAMLIDPPSPRELAARIIDLLDAPERQNELTRNAKAEWSHRFSVERYRKDVLDVIDRVARGGSG